MAILRIRGDMSSSLFFNYGDSRWKDFAIAKSKIACDIPTLTGKISRRSQMILFSHIPKCAGKSIRSSIEDAFPEEVIEYYSNPLERSMLTLAASRIRYRYSLPRKYRSDVTNISNPMIVYGHFSFDDFASLAGKKVKTATFFRDPVEWLGSYIYYMSEKYPNHFSRDVLFETGKHKLEFGYEKFLGKMQVSDLDFIGIVEEFSESLNRLEDFLGRSLVEIHKNPTRSRPRQKTYRNLFEEMKIIDEVEFLMSRNQKIYVEARNLAQS